MTNLAALPGSLDTSLFLLINGLLRHPLLDLLMPALSNKWYAFLLAAVLFPLLILRGGRRTWFLIFAGIAAVLLTDLGSALLKDAIRRVRPCHVLAQVHLLGGCTRSFSMPSNHAGNMFAVAAVIWLGWRRWPLTLAGFLLAGGVAYSRVYLGVHYPGDVLAGAVWGGAVGWALLTGVGRCFPRQLGRATPPAPPASPGPEDRPAAGETRTSEE
jgi:undecaprenyl-diphosphatase